MATRLGLPAAVAARRTAQRVPPQRHAAWRPPRASTAAQSTSPRSAWCARSVWPRLVCATFFGRCTSRPSTRLRAADTPDVTPESGKDYAPLALAVGAASAFGAGIYVFKGGDSATEFAAGYLLEQSLSVDNLFVFVLLFSSFKVPAPLQAKVLEYGLLGAALLRLIFILAGAAVLDRFRPALLLFAAILLGSSYKILFQGEQDEDEELEQNGVVRLARRLLPVAPDYDGDRFWTTVDGARTATPLLLVLVVVELSDLVFAVDSIPAVFGVTSDPFIVYSSNMFAIASLRALYTLVAGAMTELRYLEKAVALVLGFIGCKMIADLGGVHVPTLASLAVVVAALAGGVGLSLYLPEEQEEEREARK